MAVQKCQEFCSANKIDPPIRELIKFGFTEKATKFDKIFVGLLTRALCSVRATAYLSKSQRIFFKTNVVKLYYTNLKKINLSTDMNISV